MKRCIKCGSIQVSVEYVWPTDPSVDYKCNNCGHKFNSNDESDSEYIKLLQMVDDLDQSIRQLKIRIDEQNKSWDAFLIRHEAFKKYFREWEEKMASYDIKGEM